MADEKQVYGEEKDLSALYEQVQSAVKQGLSIANLDVNKKYRPYGATLLSTALLNGDVEVVKFLLGCNSIDLNIQDNNGNTALHWAIIRAHYENKIPASIVNNLIKSGANLYIPNERKETPRGLLKGAGVALNNHEIILEDFFNEFKKVKQQGKTISLVHVDTMLIGYLHDFNDNSINLDNSQKWSELKTLCEFASKINAYLDSPSISIEEKKVFIDKFIELKNKQLSDCKEKHDYPMFGIFLDKLIFKKMIEFLVSIKDYGKITELVKLAFSETSAEISQHANKFSVSLGIVLLEVKLPGGDSVLEILSSNNADFSYLSNLKPTEAMQLKACLPNASDQVKKIIHENLPNNQLFSSTLLIEIKDLQKNLLDAAVASKKQIGNFALGIKHNIQNTFGAQKGSKNDKAEALNTIISLIDKNEDKSLILKTVNETLNNKKVVGEGPTSKQIEAVLLKLKKELEDSLKIAKYTKPQEALTVKEKTERVANFLDSCTSKQSFWGNVTSEDTLVKSYNEFTLMFRPPIQNFMQAFLELMSKDFKDHIIELNNKPQGKGLLAKYTSFCDAFAKHIAAQAGIGNLNVRDMREIAEALKNQPQLPMPQGNSPSFSQTYSSGSSTAFFKPKPTLRGSEEKNPTQPDNNINTKPDNDDNLRNSSFSPRNGASGGGQ